MISLLDHIEYLTREHDCVIVPGFGAFVAQYSSHKNNNEITESITRNISFNSAISNNDGLLAQSIARKEGISYDVANELINKYVHSLHSQIEHDGEVPVGRLGFFSLEYNKLLFYPFPTKMTQNEYFGLSQIKLVPLSELQTTDINPKSTIVQPQRSFIYRFAQVAASIILLIGLSLVLSTPVINYEDIDYANLNFFTIKQIKVNENQDLYIGIPSMLEISNIQEEEELSLETSNESNIYLLNSGNYCLVVASLATKEQAEQFIKEENLTNCEIFKSTQKYRVYIARGTYNEMITLKESKYANSDEWVCRIK